MLTSILPCASVDVPSLTSLRTRIAALCSRAHVPYSGDPVAAGVLLSDGDWIPGVRVESASFSLTLPAVVNAYTTAVALGRAEDVVAVAASRPLRPEDDLYLAGIGPSAEDAAWETPAAQIRTRCAPDALPDTLGRPVSPSWKAPITSVAEGIDEVRRVAERAHVPASSFPVGALLHCAPDVYVPGVNVEHPDWTRILCAERNAIGTAQSYGLDGATRLLLTCLRDAGGTPCGACRQWIAELTPAATLWMDRHDQPPASSPISALLPGSFQGHALLPES